MISVLVVDDSTFMRNTITALLEQDSDIKIVGTARNGQEALQKAEELDPDVMTLDVDLPVLPGFPWVAPVRNWPGRGPDHHRRSRWLS